MDKKIEIIDEEEVPGIIREDDDCPAWWPQQEIMDFEQEEDGYRDAEGGFI